MWLISNFILQTVQHNAYAEDPYAKEFGIKISDKLASVEARILPAPWVLIYILIYWHGSFLKVYVAILLVSFR